MKLVAVGLGQGGGKIVDALQAEDREEEIYSSYAINTARADLEGLRYVKRSRRILIGEYEMHGEGAGANYDVGRDVVRANQHAIAREMDLKDAYPYDAFMVTAGGGGGIGSPGASIVAKFLKDFGDEPVFGLYALPAVKGLPKDKRILYSRNALQGYRDLKEEVESTILWDNDVYAGGGGTIREMYRRMNRWLATMLTPPLRASTVARPREVGERVIDAGDIIETLKGDVAIGYAEKDISKFIGRQEPKPKDIESLTKESVRNLSVPVPIEEIKTALLTAIGPADHLQSRGSTPLGLGWRTTSRAMLG